MSTPGRGFRRPPLRRPYILPTHLQLEAQRIRLTVRHHEPNLVCSELKSTSQSDPIWFVAPIPAEVAGQATAFVVITPTGLKTALLVDAARQ